ncbi:hypothetical protein [Corynebacterium otitidis]|uniref:hypothetical protein n=1 Tax=Corynebacterium otitidis TaxID=29321 RepID=UPI0006280106|nr:hypothetical protein [Corynebacterium otitidis]KKO83012.1 hypothetical protein AAV33_08825 [Corynebacterium otitidis]
MPTNEMLELPREVAGLGDLYGQLAELLGGPEPKNLDGLADRLKESRARALACPGWRLDAKEARLLGRVAGDLGVALLGPGAPGQQR